MTIIDLLLHRFNRSVLRQCNGPATVREAFFDHCVKLGRFWLVGCRRSSDKNLRMKGVQPQLSFPDEVLLDRAEICKSTSEFTQQCLSSSRAIIKKDTVRSWHEPFDAPLPCEWFYFVAVRASSWEDILMLFSVCFEIWNLIFVLHCTVMMMIIMALICAFDFLIIEAKG